MIAFPSLTGPWLVGQVDLSAYLAVAADSRLSGTVYGVRKDQDGGSSFTNVSADLVNVAVATPVWGTAIAAGDVLYIACDNPIKRLYAEIATPGQWTGTGLGIKYSTGGIFADADLTGTTDNTNGFRAAAGIRSIDITWPANIVAFSPQPGSAADITAGHAVASRQWLALYPQGLTASTVAPTITRLWIEHTDGSIVYSDLTTAANLQTTPTENTNTFFPVTESSVYYCTASPAIGERRRVYKAQAANRTRVLEYLSSAGTWIALTNIVDPSADFTIGPVAYFTTPTDHEVTWSRPADWTAQAKTFGAVSATGYWRRVRTTVVTTPGPMAPVTTTTQSRQYGTANTSGMRVTVPTVLRGVTLQLRGPESGTGAIDLEIVNLASGLSQSLQIPSGVLASPYQSFNVTDLSLAAGEQWGIRRTDASTRNFSDVVCDVEVTS